MGWSTARFGASDRLTAAGFALAATGEALWRDWGRPAWLALALVGALGCLLLALRRRHPLLALTAFVLGAAAATLVQSTLPDPTSRVVSAGVPIVALFVLCFSLAAYGGPRAMLLGAPQPVLLVVLVNTFQPSGGSVAAGVAFFSMFVVALPMLAGWLLRSRQRLLARLHAEEAELAVQHERLVRAARARESLEVSQRLDTTLDAGLSRLLGDVREVREVSGSPGDVAGREHLARLEQSARALLATTRDTVVGLARDGPLVPDGPPEPPGVAGGAAGAGGVVGPATFEPTEDTVLPWTILVAAAVGAGLVAETHADWANTAAGLALSALIVGALALSGRWPLSAILVTWLAAAGLSVSVAPLETTLTGILLLLSTPFLVAWLRDLRPAVAGLAVCVVGALVAVSGADLLGGLVLTALSWAAGRALRAQSVLLSRARAAHAELERVRADQLRDSVYEERAVLARELHDAIGHSLTVVALQAGAARRLRSSDPAKTAGALATIERVAQEGLDELRSGFRESSDVDRLDRLDRLVQDARATGMALVVDRAASPPAGLEATCHRVLQECLTNVMRHAPGATVRVTMAQEEGSFVMTVRNDAGRSEPEQPGSGRGLLGMLERLVGAGGTLAWRREPHGGFAVEARLPVHTQEPVQ